MEEMPEKALGQMELGRKVGHLDWVVPTIKEEEQERCEDETGSVRSRSLKFELQA